MAFTIRDIPAAMRLNGWTVGAALMERWFGRSARVMSPGEKDGGSPSPDIETRLVRMRWAMRFGRVVAAHDNLVSTWAERARAPAGNGLLARRVRAWPRNGRAGQPFRFGDLSLPTVAVQRTCQINFDRVKSGLFTGVDDFYAALGNATLNLAATGMVERAGRGRLKLTVDQLGFYLRDTYDFNGDQGLGSWGPSGIRRSAIGAPEIPVVAETAEEAPGQAYWRVNNASFRAYRAHHGRGGDFIILSDLAHRRLTRPVEIELPA